MKKSGSLLFTLFVLMSSMTSSFAQVTLVPIPGNSTIPAFEMAETETTNEQYKDFLNAAYSEGRITYDVDRKIVFNLDGKQMIDLGGTRVIRDHNGDGQIVHEEMENPLNRCMIAYDAATDKFEVVDPALVDWSMYFDTTFFANAADGPEDWAELNDENTGWVGAWDTDNLLPTLEEVREWPVGFMRWYGANEFAKFYGYDLPEQAQWRLAARAGQDFQYATSDGTVSLGSAVYNDLGVGNRNRGHVQAVKSIPANPYGLYSMGGNTWEWCKDWFRPSEGNDFPLNNTDGEFFIDDAITDIRLDPSQPISNANQLRKAGIGGSWNYFSLMMLTSRNGLTPWVETGNDHFGFRVVKNATPTATAQVEFVTIPGEEDVSSFQMATTEITNEQYKDFLNAAYAQGLITMTPVREQPLFTIGPYSDENMVFDAANGNPLIYLGGTRVVKDHDRDGVYTVREMENPINRCYIEFDTTTSQFQIVDPAQVDWSQYFDPSKYPNVVDSIDDWAELNEANNGRFSYGDLDKLLPTKEEVSTWPVTYVRYFGADAFAKFYGYEIPTQAQWKVAARAGKGYSLATIDGEAPNAGETAGGTDYGTNEEAINGWFDSSNGAWFMGAPVPATHPQPVKRLDPNAYGLYVMGGNTYEWTADWYEPDPSIPADPFMNRTGTQFVDGEDGREPISLDDIRIDKTKPDGQNNQYMKSGIGGAHNFPHSALAIDPAFSPHPFLGDANDHFGFRVVINESTTPTSEVKLEKAFQVFPNPANNYLEIQSTIQKDTPLNIYSTLGKLMYSSTIRGTKRVDVSQWEKGMYIITIGDVSKKILLL